MSIINREEFEQIRVALETSDISGEEYFPIAPETFEGEAPELNEFVEMVAEIYGVDLEKTGYTFALMPRKSKNGKHKDYQNPRVIEPAVMLNADGLPALFWGEIETPLSNFDLTGDEFKIEVVGENIQLRAEKASVDRGIDELIGITIMVIREQKGEKYMLPDTYRLKSAIKAGDVDKLSKLIYKKGSGGAKIRPYYDVLEPESTYMVVMIGYREGKPEYGDWYYMQVEGVDGLITISHRGGKDKAKQIFSGIQEKEYTLPADKRWKITTGVAEQVKDKKTSKMVMRPTWTILIPESFKLTAFRVNRPNG